MPAYRRDAPVDTICDWTAGTAAGDAEGPGHAAAGTFRTGMLHLSDVPMTVSDD
jgi:hypothetical protein